MTPNVSQVFRNAAKTTADKDNHRATWFVGALVVCVLNFLVFAQVRNFEFLLWDDQGYVVANMKALGGITPTSIRWAFTNNAHGWVTPIPYLMLLLNTHLFGINPAAFHLTNAAIHLGTSLVLLATMRRCRVGWFLSTLIAGIFSVHPCVVEPVAWVTGRWDVLCGLFWMLGTWSYLGYARSPSRRGILLVTLFYLCAITSKPMALPFPFAMMLLDFWPLGRLSFDDYWPFARRRASAESSNEMTSSEEVSSATEKEQVTNRWSRLWQIGVKEKLPLFALMVLFVVLAFRAKIAFLQGREPISFPWSVRIANMAETYVFYLGKLFWPVDLSFYYIHPYLRGDFPFSRALGCAALLLAITWLFISLRNRAPAYLVGWLWYLGVFVPAVGLFQYESQATADRYCYIPIVGLMIGFLAGTQSLLQSYPVRQKVFAAAGFVALLALVPLGATQASYWKNDESLNQHALQVDPTNFNALNNLGVIASNQNDDVKAAGFYQRILATWPAHVTSHVNLGAIADRAGKRDEAIQHYRNALKLRPSHDRARFSLAIDLLRENQNEEAIHLLKSHAEANQKSATAWEMLGNLYMAMKDYRASAENLLKAMELDPISEMRPKRLAEAMRLAGMEDELLSFCRNYIEQQPQRYDMAQQFAWLLSTSESERLRNGQEAVDITERLAHLSRFQNFGILETLSAAYAEMGDFDRAISTAEKAVQIAKNVDNQDAVATMRKRIRGYREGKPVRITNAPQAPRSSPEPKDRSPQTDTVDESLPRSAAPAQATDSNSRPG